jgi:peptidoglycan/LPS O-acetylase OafA/YrhL
VTRDIPALTGLRGVAALWVVAYHLREASANGGTGLFDFGPADALIAHGYLGVDLFFVLSGFIIRHVYGCWFAEQVRPQDCVRFLRYRIARLYPVHIVTLVLMLVLYGAARAVGTHPHNLNSYSIFSLLNNLTLTHAWWGAIGSPNTPARSISALLFPLGCWLLSRRPQVFPARKRQNVSTALPPALDLPGHVLFSRNKIKIWS